MISYYIVGAYLLGSIPFGLIVAKLKKIDLRKTGSANIGATNVFRQCGWKAGVIVLTLDALKAFVPTYLAVQYLSAPFEHILIGLTAIIGHSFPIFAGFRGGKGAASGLGVLAAISPLTFGICIGIAVGIISVIRYVSVATLICSIMAPFILYFLNAPAIYIKVVSVICIIIIIKHSPNIKRLLNRQENKI